MAWHQCNLSSFLGTLRVQNGNALLKCSPFALFLQTHKYPQIKYDEFALNLQMFRPQLLEFVQCRKAVLLFVCLFLFSTIQIDLVSNEEFIV